MRTPGSPLQFRERDSYNSGMAIEGEHRAVELPIIIVKNVGGKTFYEPPSWRFKAVLYADTTPQPAHPNIIIGKMSAEDARTIMLAGDVEVSYDQLQYKVASLQPDGSFTLRLNS